MKTFMFFLLFLVISAAANSQVYMTRNGTIRFFSQTPMENIVAENNQVYGVIDAGKQNIAFTLLMKSFRFKKELMQQHFNENYVESDLYPKASFTGTYSGEVNLSKDGVYPITVKGNLTIHNATQTIEQPATIEVKNKSLLGNMQFKVKPEDFNIAIPSLVRDKIAKEITIDVVANCSSLK